MTAGGNDNRTITLRRHPAFLAPRTAVALAGLIVAGVLSETSMARNSVLIACVWAAWGSLLFRLIWQIVEWRLELLIVTPEDLLRSSGVLTRESTYISIANVTNISLEQSILGQLLGYGAVILQRAGKDQVPYIIDHVPYPERLYFDLYNWIFVRGRGLYP